MAADQTGAVTMTQQTPITPLYKVKLSLVVRHVLGQPEAAEDRIGARHRRMVCVHCQGWYRNTPFAAVIRDVRGDPTVHPLTPETVAVPADAWQSIRLQALRQVPDAVWQHPFPLDTAAEYAERESELLERLRRHANDAEALTAATGTAFRSHPSMHGLAGRAPRWSPDPDEPPRWTAVFPGQVEVHGRRYRITEREAQDPDESGMLMAFEPEGTTGEALWFNAHGRIVAGTATRGARHIPS